MKKTPYILSAAAMAGLSACATLNAPMSGSGVDPLAPPGSGLSAMTTDPGGNLYTPGSFVQSAIDNTAFYKVRPKGNEEADKLLSQHTSMKVISVAGSYVKVELDSGEVGFVPSVMVEDPNFAAGMDVMADPGELPLFDANDLPPEGSIPAVIDPDMPLPDFPDPLADDGSLPSAEGSTPANELPAADGSIDALGGSVEVKVDEAEASEATTPPPSSSPETKAALQEAALGDGPKEKEE